MLWNNAILRGNYGLTKKVSNESEISFRQENCFNWHYNQFFSATTGALYVTQCHCSSGLFECMFYFSILFLDFIWILNVMLTVWKPNWPPIRKWPLLLFYLFFNDLCCYSSHLFPFNLHFFHFTFTFFFLFTFLSETKVVPHNRMTSVAIPATSFFLIFTFSYFTFTFSLFSLFCLFENQIGPL